MNEDIKIENLMKLAATGKPKRDAYYEDTFRKMLSGQKYVWNWSASLLGYYWFLYRKVYGSATFKSEVQHLLNFVETPQVA